MIDKILTHPATKAAAINIANAIATANIPKLYDTAMDTLAYHIAHHMIKNEEKSEKK